MPELEEFIWNLRLIASTGGLERLVGALQEVSEEGQKATEALEQVSRPVRQAQAQTIEKNITNDLKRRIELTQTLRKEISGLVALSSRQGLFNDRKLADDRKDLLALLGIMEKLERKGATQKTLRGIPSQFLEDRAVRDFLKTVPGGIKRTEQGVIDPTTRLAAKGAGKADLATARTGLAQALRPQLERLIKKVEVGDQQQIKALDALTREERILNQQLRARAAILAQRQARGAAGTGAGQDPLELLRRAQIRSLGAQVRGRFQAEAERIQGGVFPASRQQQEVARLRAQTEAEFQQGAREINEKILQTREQQSAIETQITNKLRVQRAQAESILASSEGEQQVSLEDLRVARQQEATEKRRRDLAESIRRIRREFGREDPRRAALITQARETEAVQARADQLRITRQINQEEEKRIANLVRIQGLIVKENLSARAALRNIQAKTGGAISPEARLGGAAGFGIEAAGTLTPRAFLPFNKKAVEQGQRERLEIEGRIQDQITAFAIEKEQQRFDLLQNKRRRLAEIAQAPDITKRKKEGLARLVKESTDFNLGALDRQFNPTIAKIKVLEDHLRRLQGRTVELRRISFDLATVSRNIFTFAASVAIPLGLGLRNLGDLQIRLGAFNAIAGQTQEEMAQTQASILRLFENVPVKSADELGLALFNIASANIDTTKAFGVLEVSAKLAAIGMVDTNNAVKILVQSMQAFQRGTSESERTAEQLVAILNTSVGEFDEVGRAVGRASAAARLANQDLAELGATFAILTTAGGLTPRRAGEAVNRFFIDIQRRRGQIKENLGFDVVADGSVQSIDKIVEAFANLAREGKVTVAGLQEVFEQDLSKRTLSILIDNVEELRKNIEEIRAPVRTLDDSFALATNNVGSNLQRLSNRFQTLFIQAADAITPAINAITNITGGITRAIAANKVWLGTLLQTGAIVAGGLGFITFFASVAVRLNLLRQDFQGFLLSREAGRLREISEQQKINVQFSSQKTILDLIKTTHVSLNALETQRLGIINAQTVALGRQGAAATAAGAVSATGAVAIGAGAAATAAGAITNRLSTVTPKSSRLLSGATSAGTKGTGDLSTIVIGGAATLAGRLATLGSTFGLVAIAAGVAKLALDGYASSVERNAKESENSIKIFQRLSTRTNLSIEELVKLEKAESQLLGMRTDVVEILRSGAPAGERYSQAIKAIQDEIDADLLFQVSRALKSFFASISSFLFETPLQRGARDIEFLRSPQFRGEESINNETRARNLRDAFISSVVPTPPFLPNVREEVTRRIATRRFITQSQQALTLSKFFQAQQAKFSKAIIEGDQTILDQLQKDNDDAVKIAAAVQAENERVGTARTGFNLGEIAEQKETESRLRAALEHRNSVLELTRIATEEEGDLLRKSVEVMLATQSQVGGPIQEAISKAKDLRGQLQGFFGNVIPALEGKKIAIPIDVTDGTGLLTFLQNSVRFGRLANPIDIDLTTQEGIDKAIEAQAILFDKAGNFARITEKGTLQILNATEEVFNAAGALAFRLEDVVRPFVGGEGLAPGDLPVAKDRFLEQQEKIKARLTQQLEIESTIATLTNAFGTRHAQLQSSFIEKRIRLVEGSRQRFDEARKEIARLQSEGASPEKTSKRLAAASANFLLERQLAAIQLQNEASKISRQIAIDLIDQVQARKNITREIELQNQKLRVQIADSNAISTAEKLRVNEMQFLLELEEIRERRNSSILDLIKEQIGRGTFDPLIAFLSQTDQTMVVLKDVIQLARDAIEEARKEGEKTKKAVESIVSGLERIKRESLTAAVATEKPEERITAGKAIEIIFSPLLNDFKKFVDDLRGALGSIKNFFFPGTVPTAKKPSPTGFFDTTTRPTLQGIGLGKVQIVPGDKSQKVTLPQDPLPVTIDRSSAPLSVDRIQINRALEAQTEFMGRQGRLPSRGAVVGRDVLPTIAETRQRAGQRTEFGIIGSANRDPRLGAQRADIAGAIEQGFSSVRREGGLSTLQGFKFLKPHQNKFDPDFAQKLLELRKRAKEEFNIDFGIVEGFRTFEEQEKIFNRRKKEFDQGKRTRINAARPGTGLHELGLAADINVLGKGGGFTGVAKSRSEIDKLRELASQIGLSLLPESNIPELNHIALAKEVVQGIPRIPAQIQTPIGTADLNNAVRDAGDQSIAHVLSATQGAVSEVELFIKNLFKDFPGVFEKIRQLTPFDFDQIAEGFRGLQTKSQLEAQLAAIGFDDRRRDILRQSRKDIFDAETEALRSAFEIEAATFRSQPEGFAFRANEIQFQLDQAQRELNNQLDELAIKFQEELKEIDFVQGPLLRGQVRIVQGNRQFAVDEETLSQNASKRQSIQNKFQASQREFEAKSIRLQIEERQDRIETLNEELAGRRDLSELSIEQERLLGRGQEVRLRALREELEIRREKNQLALQSILAEAPKLDDRVTIARIVQNLVEREHIQIDQIRQQEELRIDILRERIELVQTEQDLLLAQFNTQRAIQSLRGPTLPGEERARSNRESAIEIDRLRQKNQILQQERRSVEDQTDRDRIDLQMEENEETAKQIALRAKIKEINETIESQQARLGILARLGRVSQEEALEFQLRNAALLSRAGESTDEFLERNLGLIDTLRDRWLDHFNFLSSLYGQDFDERRRLLEALQEFFDPGTEGLRQAQRELDQLNFQRFQGLRSNLEDAIRGGIRDLFVNPANFDFNDFAQAIGGAIRGAVAERLVDDIILPAVRPAVVGVSETIGQVSVPALEKIVSQIRTEQVNVDSLLRGVLNTSEVQARLGEGTAQTLLNSARADLEAAGKPRNVALLLENLARTFDPFREQLPQLEFPIRSEEEIRQQATQFTAQARSDNLLGRQIASEINTLGIIAPTPPVDFGIERPVLALPGQGEIPGVGSSFLMDQAAGSMNLAAQAHINAAQRWTEVQTQLQNTLRGITVEPVPTPDVLRPETSVSEQVIQSTPASISLFDQAAQLHIFAANQHSSAANSLQNAATALSQASIPLERVVQPLEAAGGVTGIPGVTGGIGGGLSGIAPGILAAVPALAFAGGTGQNVDDQNKKLAEEIAKENFARARATGGATQANLQMDRLLKNIPRDGATNNRRNIRQIAGQVLAGLGVFQGGQAQGTPLGGGLLGAVTSIAGGLFGGGIGGGLIGGAIGAIGGLFGKKKKKPKEPKEFPELPEVEDVLFASRRFFQGSLEGGREGLPIIRDQQTINDNKVTVTVENINVTGQNADDIAKQIAVKLKREMSQGFR